MPQLAVDSEVDLNKCSLTTSNPALKSWFFVDLQSVYEITKVCVLNSPDGNFRYLKTKDYKLFFHLFF